MALSVLVTGASGALGQHSVRVLRDAGHEVVACGRVMDGGVDAKWDVASQDGPEPDQSADVVVHAAALRGGYRQSLDGSELLFEDATEVDLSKRPFEVRTDSKAYTADALILAMGASSMWLGIESEKRLTNFGVSACATCDGALYRGKPMAVVGGGDTALEEALFLTRFATKGTVIHRRDELRASKIMQERARKHEKIEFRWNAVVDEVIGDEFVTGVKVRDVVTHEISEIPVEALFIAIGHQPNTSLFEGQLNLDPSGYVKVESGSTRTSVEGVFCAGDASDPTYRQAVTAAGTGCMAAIDAERWLAEQGIE